MHGFAVSCRVSRREIRSDWCSSWHGIEAGLSIMAMRFDDRAGQSGRIANFVHPARGFIACPVRSGMRMGCSARSAQGCDADACTTPAKWHNARVVRGGICTTAIENDCAHCCTPTEFLETLEFQRNEEWRARSLGKVFVQLLRLPTMRALYRRICTAGGDWALIGDVGMRLVAITVREKRLCEKWESHDMNGVPMKHDGADAPRGACAIIRMVRVRSASGREGLVVRLGVCL